MKIQGKNSKKHLINGRPSWAILQIVRLEVSQQNIFSNIYMKQEIRVFIYRFQNFDEQKLLCAVANETDSQNLVMNKISFKFQKIFSQNWDFCVFGMEMLNSPFFKF